MMTLHHHTSGKVDGRDVSIDLTNREPRDQPEPPVIEMTVTLPMSYEDIDAVLWDSLSGNPWEVNFPDPDHVRELLLHLCVSIGGNGIVKLRNEVQKVSADHPDAPLLDKMRKLVRELFPAVDISQ